MRKLSTLIHYKYLSPRSPRLLEWYLKLLEKNKFIDQDNKAHISAVVPKNFSERIHRLENIAKISNYTEYNSSVESFEEITLNKIPKMITDTGSEYIAYFNTKGNSHSKFRRSSIDWPYSAITNLGSFLPLILSNRIKGYDAYGSYLTYSTFGQKLSKLIAHYPGNFWIADSQYLNSLGYNILTASDRYSSEYLIGTAMGNFYNIQSYPGGMYNFKSTYHDRKIIKDIAKELMYNARSKDDSLLSDYYMGSELVMGQTGFPDFIMPPSWVKYFKNNEDKFLKY